MLRAGIRTMQATIALLATLAYTPVHGQVTPATILVIDIEDQIQYVADTFDLSKLATAPSATPAAPSRNFREFMFIGDIVAINGQPVRGVTVRNARAMSLSPVPAAGQAIADVTRGAIFDQVYEILKIDGTPIGTIMVSGVAIGSGPPGAPLAVTEANTTIVGGTGAFLGARGLVGAATTAPASMSRTASMVEDPGNRRTNGGGGRTRHVMHLIPMARPEIVVAASGPVVLHSDFSPVTTAKPAQAGERLITMATGLGPTRPGVDPGQPFPSFPANPLQVINSPVSVIVNGMSIATINQIGWPGSVDTYRVDFQVPAGLTPGMAEIQLTAAWVTGSPVRVPVQ